MFTKIGKNLSPMINKQGKIPARQIFLTTESGEFLTQENGGLIEVNMLGTQNKNTKPSSNFRKL